MAHQLYSSVVSTTLWKLPKIKILKFTGDPTNYIRFIKTFKANVESVIDDSNRHLLLLIQHCEGDPKKLRVLYNARPTHSDIKIYTNNEIGPVNLARDLEKCKLIFRELKLRSNINNFEAIGKVIK